MAKDQIFHIGMVDERPAARTGWLKDGPIAQLDRVADFYSAGCRFESCWDRHVNRSIRRQANCVTKRERWRSNLLLAARPQPRMVRGRAIASRQQIPLQVYRLAWVTRGPRCIALALPAPRSIRFLCNGTQLCCTPPPHRLTVRRLPQPTHGKDFSNFESISYRRPMEARLAVHGC